MPAVPGFIETGPGNGARTTFTSHAHPTTSTTAPASAAKLPHKAATFDALDAPRHLCQPSPAKPGISGAPGSTGD